MLNIILFGSPGSGKGTQSERWMDKYDLIHLSTGDILRSEIAEGTELGLRAKELMDEGNLVPDEVVIGMISSKLDDFQNARGFIFDGFPRTIAQAKALDELLKEKNTAITILLVLEVEEEELIKRLLKRGIESGRPDDQNESVIHNRIVEYNKKTSPVISFYQKQGILSFVKGTGNVEEIFHRLCMKIDKLVF